MQAKIYEFLKNQKKDTKLLVTKDTKHLENISDVARYLGYKTFVFPEIRVEYGEDLRAYKGEIDDLLTALLQFYQEKSPKKIIISPFYSLLYPLPKEELLQTFKLEFAQHIDIGQLKDKLYCWGYNFVDIIQEKGEVSFRGDIIDIFSPNHKKPYRISLFDDEIESIRHFEVESQKSIKDELEFVEIMAGNYSLSLEQYKSLEKKIENLQSDSFVKDIGSLGFWVLDDLACYLPALVDTYFCDDIDEDFLEFKSFYGEVKDIREFGKVIEEPKIYKDINPLEINSFLEFHKDKKIKILSKNEAVIKSSQIKDEYKKFIVKDDKIINIVSKSELIISLNKRASKKSRRRAKIILDELKAGDYVVHEEYGIGIFKGLQSTTVLGATRDYILIVYQNDDKLLLPVENIDKIDRYIADSGTLAVLDRLGKGSFAKMKAKVKEKLFEIAKEIVEIAALRELEKGIKIKEPVELGFFQQEAGFLYTEDQQKAIEDIVRDLNSGRIMDRLLSGDVGFGKTEVAMNALFCAIKSGYQTAFVAPTTLLVEQHYKSLKDRFAKFNINVYKLDRFISAKEKKEILKGLESGDISVCVGTHALFNAKFNNLALLVIDEEHKFGVKQKEKLKNLKQDVHVLSMSATPIPRSLNMALSSIKQYSQILTPPVDKKGVRTFVKDFSKPVIKEVILREIRRGGQIFFVHNRIATIEERKKYLQELLPHIKIVTLHSKINPAQMEKEMLLFEKGEYDLLLSTSIVESGLHMPKVNSMIIENADRFGIADLHQLRGRVGRGKVEGYCYLLVENREKLEGASKKRLLALESNSFLGSGSVLAYHDLEIRGGGNLIGKAQSGHIKNIGYTQYLKMLEDAINELLNKKVVQKEEVNIKLNVTAYIEDNYIKEDRLRLDIYRRLGACESLSEVYEIEEEMYDRFGEIPAVTKRFLDIISIKILAINRGIALVSSYQQNITFTKTDGDKIDIKAKSKDDDDIIESCLKYLREKEGR